MKVLEDNQKFAHNESLPFLVPKIKNILHGGESEPN